MLPTGTPLRVQEHAGETAPIAREGKHEDPCGTDLRHWAPGAGHGASENAEFEVNVTKWKMKLQAKIRETLTKGSATQAVAAPPKQAVPEADDSDGQKITSENAGEVAKTLIESAKVAQQVSKLKALLTDLQPQVGSGLKCEVHAAPSVWQAETAQLGTAILEPSAADESAAQAGAMGPPPSSTRKSNALSGDGLPKRDPSQSWGKRSVGWFFGHGAWGEVPAQLNPKDSTTVAPVMPEVLTTGAGNEHWIGSDDEEVADGDVEDSGEDCHNSESNPSEQVASLSVSPDYYAELLQRLETESAARADLEKRVMDLHTERERLGHEFEARIASLKVEPPEPQAPVAKTSECLQPGTGLVAPSQHLDEAKAAIREAAAKDTLGYLLSETEAMAQRFEEELHTPTSAIAQRFSWAIWEAAEVASRGNKEDAEQMSERVMTVAPSPSWWPPRPTLQTCLKSTELEVAGIEELPKESPALEEVAAAQGPLHMAGALGSRSNGVDEIARAREAESCVASLAVSAPSAPCPQQHVAPLARAEPPLQTARVSPLAVSKQGALLSGLRHSRSARSWSEPKHELRHSESESGPRTARGPRTAPQTRRGSWAALKPQPMFGFRYYLEVEGLQPIAAIGADWNPKPGTTDPAVCALAPIVFETYNEAGATRWGPGARNGVVIAVKGHASFERMALHAEAAGAAALVIVDDETKSEKGCTVGRAQPPERVAPPTTPTVVVPASAREALRGRQGTGATLACRLCMWGNPRSDP